MKCFCGKEATYFVRVISDSKHDYKFTNCPRCDDCTKRALNSYKDVKIELIETENDS